MKKYVDVALKYPQTRSLCVYKNAIQFSVISRTLIERVYSIFL